MSGIACDGVDTEAADAGSSALADGFSERLQALDAMNAKTTVITIRNTRITNVSPEGLESEPQVAPSVRSDV